MGGDDFVTVYIVLADWVRCIQYTGIVCSYVMKVSTIIDMVGSYTDRSRAGTIDQVQKGTRVRSSGCLAMGKTGKTSVIGWDLAPSISLVKRFGPSLDLSSLACCESCGRPPQRRKKGAEKSLL